MIKITGDLKQKGEPTPDNPVEIENENYLIEEKNNKIIKKIPLGKIDLGEIELAKAKEKSADQMFEELGYMIREFKTDEYIVYGYKNRLLGDLIEHTISFRTKPKIVMFDGTKGFGMQELQAINKKCQEMGWLE